jgi:AraC family cel operon transcriptional repressor
MKQKEYFIEGVKRFVQLSGMTPEWLSREMRRYYNCTPTDFVNGLRIGEAARLLKTTEMSVLDIQYDCGFGNTAHFNKLFHKEFGVTPSRYRRISRG